MAEEAARKFVAQLGRQLRRESTGSITAHPNPVHVSLYPELGMTTLSWTSKRTETVEVRVGAPDGPLVSRAGPTGSASTGKWVRNGMVFYLQDVSGGLPLTAANTLAAVRVQVTTTEDSTLNAPARVLRRLRKRFAPKGLVLMYHRVSETRPDPWSLCVTPSHFEEHMQVLRSHSRPMPLQQLVQALQDGKLPRRAVVVTFDDGYADNLHNGKPLLEQYDTPATAFLVTEYIGGPREFWWDELERVLLQPGSLPEVLGLSINGGIHRWELGAAAHYGQDAHRSHLGWRAREGQDPTPRHALCRSLQELLAPLAEGKRRDVLDTVEEWAGAERVVRSTHRSLALSEVAALAEGGLLEVGAHSVTHPMLSTLSVASQRDEIQQSRACLEEVLGFPVTSFAYPYGDYAAETISVVRQAGFTCACSCHESAIEPSSDRFQLPRMEVHDWDGDEFARRLRRWFGS